jgi:hypothetical protein
MRAASSFLFLADMNASGAEVAGAGVSGTRIRDSRAPAKMAKTKETALTAIEVQAFLNAAKEICEDYYPLFLTGFRAGLRRGELVALQWGDIQFGADEADTNRFIPVQHNYVRREHTTTKSKKGRRVDLSCELRRVLIKLRDKRLLRGFLDGKRDISGFYRHFKSKDDLLVEAVARAFDEMGRGMVEVCKVGTRRSSSAGNDRMLSEHTPREFAWNGLCGRRPRARARTKAVLPGQSRRTIGWAVGSRILPSDFGRAAAADYARTRVPNSSATSS